LAGKAVLLARNLAIVAIRVALKSGFLKRLGYFLVNLTGYRLGHGFVK
jgi:hypothetical protein